MGDLTLHIPCFVRVVRVLREVRDGIVDRIVDVVSTDVRSVGNPKRDSLGEVAGPEMVELIPPEVGVLMKLTFR